jgi:hypothetical protein
MSEHWIIEHPSYGVFYDWEFRYSSGATYLKFPKFAWSVGRDEGTLFYNKASALAALEQCRNSGRRGMDKACIMHWTGKQYVKE